MRTSIHRVLHIHISNVHTYIVSYNAANVYEPDTVPQRYQNVMQYKLVLQQYKIMTGFSANHYALPLVTVILPSDSTKCIVCNAVNGPLP